MKNSKNSELTEMQFTTILIGSMIGTGVLSLPNDVIKVAKQDGWISIIVGSLYPLYIVFVASYLSKNYPKESLLDLSRKFLGNLLGTILNLIFISFFIFITTKVASDISNVLKIYVVTFLNKWNLLIVMYSTLAYTVYGGAKTVGRLNEFIFWSTIIIFFVPLIALEKGSILNLKPIFQNGALTIIKAGKETAMAYAQIEIILLLYPFLQDNNKIKKCGLISVLVVTVVYLVFTIVDIMYLGINTSLKFMWPLVTITEAIMIPLINSFRFIFMSLWSLTMFKTICNGYFVTVHELSKMTKKIDRKVILLLTIPLMILLGFSYGNITKTRKLTDKVLPIYVIYNTAFSALITLLAWRNKSKEKKKLLNPNT